MPEVVEMEDPMLEDADSGSDSDNSVPELEDSQAGGAQTQGQNAVIAASSC